MLLRILEFYIQKSPPVSSDFKYKIFFCQIVGCQGKLEKLHKLYKLQMGLLKQCVVCAGGCSVNTIRLIANTISIAASVLGSPVWASEDLG